jgi:hypothetical protein
MDRRREIILTISWIELRIFSNTLVSILTGYPFDYEVSALLSFFDLADAKFQFVFHTNVKKEHTDK